MNLVLAALAIGLLASSWGARAAVVWVQDNDPSIVYKPSVLPGGAGICQNHATSSDCSANWWIEFSIGGNGTMYWTCGVGNSMTYTFQGSEIAWFSRPGSLNTPVTYTIDGGPPKSGVATVTADPQAFFRETGLDSTKNHTLVVMNASSNCVGFDFMQITIPDDLSPSTSSPSATLSPNPSQSSTSKSSSNTGAIVGGIVGGVVGVILVALITVWAIKRRKSQPEMIEQGKVLAEQLAGTPRHAVPEPQR
jgi:hypothetical protein